MIKRSWNTVLAGVALVGGLAVLPTANAGEVYSAGGPEACEKVFADQNNDLTIQLASMSCCEESCCAPAGCCDGGCGESCYTGCGEGCCGGGGCGLFSGGGGGEITFGGWVQFGYHSGVTPAGTTPNDAGSFNNHPHRFNLHQGWLYAEKVADGSSGLDWGFRADVMYGVDAGDTQSFGNPAGSWDNGGSFTRGAGYGWAIPQLYAELASGDWSIKAGHFYTLVGYEVVTAPDNFFYSHALTMFNSEPFTHTGVLASYSATDDTTLYAGWTAGWDSGFDSVNGGSNFLGGFSTAVGDNASFTYITTIGNFGARSLANGSNHGYSHSMVLDVALSDDLNLVLQSDLVRVGADDDVGINTYLIKSLSDKLGVGVRTEWWKNEGDSQYAVTGGVNIKPTDNLIIRPEIRHDWHDPNVGSETTFGVDAILTF